MAVTDSGMYIYEEGAEVYEYFGGSYYIYNGNIYCGSLTYKLKGLDNGKCRKKDI